MKKQINEIKKMQLLAGLITESEYRESLMNENVEDLKESLTNEGGRIAPYSDDEDKETRRAGKAAGDLFRRIGNMGDVNSVTSLIKGFVNKKYPELKIKIKGINDNIMNIYSKNPKSKVITAQVGGDGIWEVFVLEDKSYSSAVEDQGKTFGKKPGKEMIQYIDSKIKQYF